MKKKFMMFKFDVALHQIKQLMEKGFHFNQSLNITASEIHVRQADELFTNTLPDKCVQLVFQPS